MTHESMDEMFSVIRRASGLLQDDLTFQVLAHPSRRPPQFSDPAWMRRPEPEQLKAARENLEAFARGDDSGLALAGLFLCAAVCRRGEQRGAKKNDR